MGLFEFVVGEQEV